MLNTMSHIHGPANDGQQEQSCGDHETMRGQCRKLDLFLWQSSSSPSLAWPGTLVLHDIILDLSWLIMLPEQECSNYCCFQYRVYQRFKKKGAISFILKCTSHAKNESETRILGMHVSFWPKKIQDLSKASIYGKISENFRYKSKFFCSISLNVTVAFWVLSCVDHQLSFLTFFAISSISNFAAFQTIK